jgi:archaellum component FlaC
MPIKPQRLSEIKKQIAEEKMLAEMVKCELSV